jgi:hypothetical protein
MAAILPTIVPTGYDGTAKDFTKVPYDGSGAARIVSGAVSVPSLTAADTYVGLVPFNKGAKFHINSESIHAGNFGGATTTLNIGVIYNDAVNTQDADAFSSLSAAPQAGGFVAVDEIAGMTFVAQGDGWLAAQLKALDADATANITFNVLVAYG